MSDKKLPENKIKSETLTAEQVCNLFFEYTRNRYFKNNKFAQKYTQNFRDGDYNAMTSDHTAFRCNSLQSFKGIAAFLLALNLEPYETEKSKGLADKINDFIKNNNPAPLKIAEFSYNFDGLGLHSTHFDIAGDALKKGTHQKIFISLPKIQIFPSQIQKLIEQDSEIYTNKFSENGQEIIAKLANDKKISATEAEQLITDFDQNYSVRKIPMLASTFAAISNCKMNIEGSKNAPSITAIGMGCSGVLNHHTVEETLENITSTPLRLKQIGVLPGDPPVQFDGPIVQTNSKGVPHQLELLNDNSNENIQKINEIISANLSDDAKRQQLIAANLITTKEVAHEYVEYICRAQLAKVKLDGVEQNIYVWQRGNKYFSAMLEHRNKKEYEAKVKEIQAKKRSETGDFNTDFSVEIATEINGFDYYPKQVEFISWVRNSDGEIVKASGFTANNAANIFLATEIK